jgi:hypothetical protein
MASVQQPLRGIAPLLTAVAMLSMATGTLRLKLGDWLKASSNPALPPTVWSPVAAATAMPTWLHEPPSLATMAAIDARDLASPDAAAARAKAVVQRSFGIANAKILEPAIAKRIGDGSSASRSKRSRYQTEFVVEMPRGCGPPIQRQYYLTFNTSAAGEWQVEEMTFATRY